MRKIAFFIIFTVACSPIKSSPKEEKHQMEMTVHEIQTNIDDLKHDLHSMQAEFQILDGKVASENSGKRQVREDFVESVQNKIDFLTKEIGSLSTRFSSLEKKQENLITDLKKISSHANETSMAISQYKDRMGEIEKEVTANQHRLDDIAKLKTTLDSVAKSLKNSKNEPFSTSYRVKPGDSLKKIAKSNKVSVEDIKKANNLEHDLIVVGQELFLPISK